MSVDRSQPKAYEIQTIMTTPSPSPPLSTEQTSETAGESMNAGTALDRQFKFTLTEGILLAASTGVFYLLAFIYEWGYARHFGIPIEFVNVGLTNVLFTMALMLILIGVLLGLANIIAAFPALRVSREGAFRLIIFTTVNATVVFLAYLSGNWYYWKVFGISFSVLALVLYVFPWMNKRRRVKVATWLPFPNLRLVPFTLLMAIWFVYGAVDYGDAIATKQKQFLTTNYSYSASQEMVLLRVYGDNLVLAPFNRNTKEVQMSFTILKVSDLKTALTLEEVGPLKPVPAKPAQAPAPQPSAPTPSPPTSATSPLK